jgi:hypothetical protein
VIHVYHRTGPRSAVSMPLWLALIVYSLAGAALVALAAALLAVVVAVAVAFVLLALSAAGIGWVRRRLR